MTMQRGKLADIQTIATTAGSIYANPASTKTYIKTIIIHNTNTTAETVQVFNVPDSSGSLGTAVTTNRFINVSLAANDTLEFSPDYPIVLTDTNDSIQASTTTASKVTVMLHGDKDA